MTSDAVRKVRFPFLFISYCVGARTRDDNDDDDGKKRTKKKKEREEIILMIYVNHDNKNAEAKKIFHEAPNLLLFISMLMLVRS